MYLKKLTFFIFINLKANIFANHLADILQPYNTKLLPEKINVVELFF